MIDVFFYSGLVLWNGMGFFGLYTMIRDDIRREKERKNEKAKY